MPALPFHKRSYNSQLSLITLNTLCSFSLHIPKLQFFMDPSPNTISGSCIQWLLFAKH